MKEYFVYELINLLGTIEYVGETQHPKQRFNYHKSNAGNFTKRQDLIMNIVNVFNTEREAWDYQCKLQNEYGLKTDREIMSEAMQKIGFKKGVQSLGGKSGFISQNIELKCPHCNNTGIGRIMYRWHFDNCKNKA